MFDQIAYLTGIRNMSLYAYCHINTDITFTQIFSYSIYGNNLELSLLTEEILAQVDETDLSESCALPVEPAEEDLSESAGFRYGM